MNRSTVFKRSISALLCLAMAVSFCCIFEGAAEAKTSLPGVEDIKTSDEVLTILEIVPDAMQGSIGYYIDGEEPWAALTGSLYSGDAGSRTQRVNFVNNELRDLLNKSRKDEDHEEYNYALALCDPETLPDGGELSNYPLKYVGGYTEVYPWVYATATDTTYKNYKQMPLKDAETDTVEGEMDYVGLGYGEYTIGDYEYVGAGGDCVQLITGFETEPDTGDSGYWYNVSFSELSYDIENDQPTEDAAKWTVIYEEVDNSADSDLYVGGKYYRYIGVVGERDFPGLNINNTYYMAKCGQPYATKALAQADTEDDEVTLFADTADGFRDKEAGEIGYFSKISYEYVGDGNGAYSFVPSTGGTEYKVSTKIVYYTGGFNNNNWFLKYVMDYDEDELNDPNVKKPEISVNTVAAREVTEAQYNAADMIVLNYGLDIEGETFSGIFKNDFSSGQDLPTALVDDIATTSKPAVFDYNLSVAATSNGTNVRSTAAALLDKALAKRDGSDFSTSSHHTFVGGNIYCIDSLGWITGSGDETIYHPELPLATSDFNSTEVMVGDNVVKEGPFYPVYEELVYENFLREIRDESDEEKLSDKITVAAVLRYIINYANTRQTDAKTEIRVLDIEPRTGSISKTQKDKLVDWLGISENRLFVTTMSTAEFIGSQADISEDYDLLYIGDSADGFNTDSDWFSTGWWWFSGSKYSFKYITYNDDAMTYRESSDKSGINNDTIAEYIKNRQKASWFFNMNASDVVFGMRYTSIGDKVTSGKDYQLSGLLDRDYNSNSTIKKSGSTNLFRYSGNDLTEAASKKIQDFAGSGYPVIVADSLLQPPEFDDDTLKDAKASRGLGLANYVATPNIYVADSILKVSLSRSSGFFSWLYWLINSADCQLYKNGEPAEDEDGNLAIETISPFRSVSFNLSDYDYKSGDEFYCKVTITSLRSILNLFHPISPRSSTPGYTSTVTIRGMAEDMFVDNSSVMYETINSIVGKANVTNWSSLDSEVTDIKQTLLARSANLSKPIIEFWNDSFPTSYKMTDGVMNCLTDDDNDGIYELEYVFKIKNNADPYPLQTRYKANLYLDLNGNGLYEDDELVNDVGLRNWTAYENYGSAGMRATNGELMGSYGDKTNDQNYYYLSYEIPSSMVGIIPWKLEVEDVNYFGGHDSVIDYSRVAPTDKPDVLQILQIDSADTGNHFSLQDNIEDGGLYDELLKAVKSDFKVNIATIKSDFDNTWAENETSYTTETRGADGTTTATAVTIAVTKSADNKYIKTISKSVDGSPAVTETEEYESIAEFLESYDMLIIGFGDAYKNLSLDVTKALAEYINADKPVLMTHDTLSFYSYKRTDEYNYYPNMLIRDLIGMDRYGVTSLKALSNGQSTGITKYADSALRTYIKSLPGFDSWVGGYVPSTAYYSDGATINETRKDLLDEISKAGYSIAWKANKSRTQTVSEAQGLTNAVLFRFMDNSVSSWLTGRDVDSYSLRYTNSDSGRLGLTTKTTQVNKGQITTYPYDVNTEAFDGGTYDFSQNNSMSVALTHAQNYQLNMNSDDMIVWYCLAEDTDYGSGIYPKNDVTNAYYVYTCGNVTYTGSGHTTDSVNENEAKLFVNTMIAAYRVDRSGSTVSFSNDDGTVKGIQDFFVPTDGDTVLSVDDVKYSDSARKIYFTVNDSNVDDGKYMCATLSYNESTLPISIYDADNNKEVYRYNNGIGEFVGSNTTLISTYTYYVKLDDVINAIKKIKSNNEEVTIEDLNRSLSISLSTIYSSGSATPTTSTASLNLRQYKLFDLS